MQRIGLLAGALLTALFVFPTLGSAQTMSIVSGNGQLVCVNCPGATPYKPLVAQVNDANGNPVANTTVTWTSTQQNFTPVTLTSQTDSHGQATCSPLTPTCAFQPYAFFFGNNVLPATIVASALGTSVTFYETTALPSGAGISNISLFLLPNNSGTPALSGPVGSTAAPLKVQVANSFGPLPNISVNIQSGSAGQPTLSCITQPGQPAGFVLTDATGLATCTPQFGGKAGNGTYALVVGGNFESYGATNLTVKPGNAALLSKITGDNQSVNLNATTPLALSSTVTDLGGNTISGAQVSWAVTGGSATLSSVVSTSSNIGVVSAKVTPTALPGPVLVTLKLLGTTPVVTYQFTTKINTIITGLTAVSSTTEEAKAGTQFPDPLVVQVSDNNVPVPGAVVNFVVTSGSVTLSSPGATADANGQASVTVTAGQTPGPAIVTASISSGGKTYTVPFNLKVDPLGPLVTGIYNAAGFQSQFVSPCSLAYITGSGFTDGLQGVIPAFITPQALVAGVTVTLNGVYAPILDVANESGQESIGIQIPCELQASSMPITANMVVSADGSPSQPFSVTISTYSPGIFEAIDPTDNVKRAVLLRPDGSYVSVTNPARRGETIRMFVTGLGQTSPVLFTNELDPTTPGPDNTLIPQFPVVNASVVVGVNNGGVNVVQAVYAYGMVGVYEVDFVVPQNTTPGNNAPFAIAIYVGQSLLFGNGSLIPIQ